MFPSTVITSGISKLFKLSNRRHTFTFLLRVHSLLGPTFATDKTLVPYSLELSIIYHPSDCHLAVISPPTRPRVRRETSGVIRIVTSIRIATHEVQGAASVYRCHVTLVAKHRPPGRGQGRRAQLVIE